MSKKLWLMILILGVSGPLQASTLSQYWSHFSANQAYDNAHFQSASDGYLDSLKKGNGYPESLFNLGNSYYRDSKWRLSEAAYLQADAKLEDPIQKSRVWFNIANSRMAQDQTFQAIQAYKRALRLDPNHQLSKIALELALQSDSPQSNESEQDQSSKNQEEDPSKTSEQQNQKPISDSVLRALESQERQFRKTLQKKAESRYIVEKDW